MGWLSDEIRRHRRGRVHRLAPRGGAPGGGSRGRRDRLFTDYYDPALKEGNARGLDVRRLDLAADELDLTGFDGVFHLAGQPGVRSFGDVFQLYVDATCSRASASSRRRRRRRPRRLRLLVVDLRRGRALSDAGGHAAAAVSPYGITKLACEHLARAYARSFGLDAVVLRYFNAYGPRQRPDMAFPRIVDALAEGEPFALFGDGEQSRELHLRGRRRRGDAPRDGAAPTGAIYNVGGGDEATMNETIALLEQIAGRSLDVRREPGRGRRPAADEGRHDAGSSAELGWQPETPLEDGLRPSGMGGGRVAAR